MKSRGFQTVAVGVGLVAVCVASFQLGRGKDATQAARVEKDERGIRGVIDLWLSSVRRGRGEQAKVLFYKGLKSGPHFPDLDGLQSWEVSDIRTQYSPQDSEGNPCLAYGSARVVVTRHREPKTLKVHLLKHGEELGDWWLATTEELD